MQSCEVQSCEVQSYQQQTWTEKKNAKVLQSHVLLNLF